MLSSEEAIRISATLTQAGIEHSAGFVLGNEDDHKAAAQFMDVMYEKLSELASRHMNKK